MTSSITMDTGHTAPVTDAAVDSTGKRMASCSEDGFVRIFAADEHNPDKWAELTVLKAHAGRVLCVAWAPSAHYPSAVLSCGEDRQIILWSDLGQSDKWIKVYSTTLSSVPWCAAWAPPEYGKMFAVGCASGSVTMFVGHDQQWSQTEFGHHPNGCCSLSWAPSLPPGALLTLPLESEVQPGGMTGLPIAPPRLVTCGSEKCVTVWQLFGNPMSGEWRPQELSSDVEASWREVAWAPGVGMPFTYIAAGSDEGFVVVWSQDGPPSDEWNHMVLQQLEDSVTKLSWSLVGTFLLVSCANGTASMWKESASRVWELACELDGAVE